jgi:DNA primase
MAHEVLAAPTIRTLVLAHYERVADFLIESFPRAPIVPVYYPHGLDKDPEYRGPWYAAPPVGAHAVGVGDPARPHAYLTLERETLLWLARDGAVGLESWTPSTRDPESVGYARITLKPRGGATQEHLAFAMLGLQTALLNCGAESIPVLNGVDGATLFIPFADAPTYESVRTWLHGIADRVVRHSPNLCTTDSHDHVSERVHVNVMTNAVGHFSSLPYALIGTKRLAMVVPMRWTELGTVKNGDFHATNSAQRLVEGDLFARLSAEIGTQRFSAVAG